MDPGNKRLLRKPRTRNKYQYPPCITYMFSRVKYSLSSFPAIELCKRQVFFLAKCAERGNAREFM